MPESQGLNSGGRLPNRPRRKYRFFFSYSSKSDDNRLRRFYSDLTDRVWALTGGAKEDVSFLDKETVKTGNHWQQLMLDALDSSQVLVYLVSSFYIESEYCGRELQAFLQREEKLKELNPNAPERLYLRPVVWTPIRTQLPPILGGIQWRDNSLPDDFARRGLQTYMGESDKTVYERLVESLANSIVDTGDGDPLPALGRYRTVEEIPNAFEVRPEVLPAAPQEELVPRMKCIYVAARQSEIKDLRSETASYSPQGGWFWRPYYPESTTIGPLLQRFITDFLHDRIDLVLEGNDLDAKIRDIITRLKEAANQDEIVIVVVDAWSAYLDQYRRFIEQFDAEVTYNQAVLVPWNESDLETVAKSDDLELQVKLLFRAKSQLPQYFKLRIRSVREFEEILPDLLRTMRRMIEAYRADRRRIIQPTRSTPPVVRTSSGSSHHV